MSEQLLNSYRIYLTGHDNLSHYFAIKIIQRCLIIILSSTVQKKDRLLNDLLMCVNADNR